MTIASSLRPTRRATPIVLTLLLISLIPLAAQLTFSWIGFNPTDDGFILAYSRRILNGEVPHLNFISIRPAGSPLLHLAELGLDDYTLWGSRLVAWFQLTIIAWTWTEFCARRLRLRLTIPDKTAWVLIGVALCAHTFPIMVWHTLDALFLTCLGIWLASSKTGRTRLAGYAMIGAAYLCKQNFALLVPLALLSLGDWRKGHAWIAGAVPGLAYVVYLAITGALSPALLQLTSQTDLWETGVVRFVRDQPLFLPLAFGFAATALLFESAQSRGGQSKFGGQYILGTLLLLLPVGYAAVALGTADYVQAPAFSLFAVALGALIYFWIRAARTGLAQASPGAPPSRNHEPNQFSHVQVGTLGIGTAWAAAISLGYNTPASASGIVALLLLAYVYSAYRAMSFKEWRRYFPTALVLVITILTLFEFGLARQSRVYRERPVSHLTPLDGILRGARGLSSNVNTRAFLDDLNAAIVQTKGETYAILPDLAAYWVQAGQSNPLPLDWVQRIELSNPRLEKQVLDAIERKRGEIAFIVQKVEADRLAVGFLPFNEPDYSSPANYVRQRLSEVAETRYFEIYH